MGNRSKSVLTYCLVILLQIHLAKAGLWSVDLDYGPAPGPAEGPPFSAHATRNRSLLPAQVCGIVGAYIGVVFIIGSLFLTIGRRLRRQAQSSRGSLSVEMVKPNPFGTSPNSPVSQHSWYSPRRLKKKTSVAGSARSDGHQLSPTSAASFDLSVLEADKVAREQELENLYAAALAQEAAKSEDALDGRSDRVLPVDPRRPPQLLTSAPALAHLNVPSPLTPKSTKSPIRAIYPPDAAMPAYASSPTSPVRAEYLPSPSSSRHRASSVQQDSEWRLSQTSSTASQASGRRAQKRFRKSLRGLHISAPSPKYPGEASDEEAHTPLTPRHYTDPGMPPSPPTARSETATTPGTHEDYAFSPDSNAGFVDEIKALPKPAPHRSSGYQYQSSAQHGNTDVHKRASATTAAAAAAAAAVGSNASSSTIGTLPFRTMTHQQQQAAAAAGAAGLAAPGAPLASPRSATKVTYLERKRDVGGGAQRTGLATPYSPYMPFTPVTPVTPRLMSRAERKQREKEEGRRVLGEEDRVVEEDEMWGSGY